MPFIVPKFDTQTVLTVAVAACIGGGGAVLYYTYRAELDRLRAERYDSTKAQSEVWDVDAIKRAFSFFDGNMHPAHCVVVSLIQLRSGWQRLHHCRRAATRPARFITRPGSGLYKQNDRRDGSGSSRPVS